MAFFSLSVVFCCKVSSSQLKALDFSWYTNPFIASIFVASSADFKEGTIHLSKIKELSFLEGFTTLTYDTGNTEIVKVKSKAKSKAKSKTKSKAIYYKSKFNELRATTIYDVIKINPLIGKEFTSCGFANNSKITCYDLIKYNGDSKRKVGISFVSGDYEARLIKGKSALLYKQKITRTFKGKK